MGKSGGSISNEAQENLDTGTSEDGRAQVCTLKALSWHSKVAWKLACVTLPSRKLLPLKVITKLHKAHSLFEIFKTAFFLEK